MYEAHFRLQRPPFSIAPDPRALYLSEPHREALAHLGWGLRGGSGGIVLLTGEIGAGKTTLCRCLLEQAPARCRIAYIYNPRLSVRELLQAVCEEFGLQVEAGGGGGLKGPIDTLNRFLLEGHAAGRQAVLVIDEAQNLSIDLLEQLRLLTNLETSERKLLQIVLVGQPELRQMVARPELAQLAQRIVARCHLGPLDERQTLAYVAHRMTVAGASGPLPFDAPALRLIHRLSGGLPRRINLLCDRALLGAWAHGRAAVDAEVVRRAATEVIGEPVADGARAPRPLRAAHGLSLGPGMAASDTAAGGDEDPGRGAGAATAAAVRPRGRPPTWAAAWLPGLIAGMTGALLGGALLLGGVVWWTGGAWPPGPAAASVAPSASVVVGAPVATPGQALPAQAASPVPVQPGASGVVGAMPVSALWSAPASAPASVPGSVPTTAIGPATVTATAPVTPAASSPAAPASSPLRPSAVTLRR